MKQRIGTFLDGVLGQFPRLGPAGSRSALLHADATAQRRTDARFDFLPSGPGGTQHATLANLRTFFVLRWAGTVGSLLIAFGALGAGALPVVGNPYDNIPFGSLMSRMLQSSSALVMVGAGLLVVAWVFLAPFVGTPLRGRVSPSGVVTRPHRLVTSGQLWRTWACWVIPLILTAPLFTQDIYSYLANGSVVAQGMDPYSAGPVQLLGADDQLARSVPFIWANSTSPYGPVALGLAAVVSITTDNSIVIGVIAHRLLSLLGIVAGGWAMTRLAQRCRVSPASALWLGILNPLTTLHLVGGIHNEAIMMGLGLVGMELGLRGIDRLSTRQFLPLLLASGFLISCAGMVKVTGFIPLGFVGMALARRLRLRYSWPAWKAIAAAIAAQLAALLISIAIVTLVTGIDIGWISGQGGAATVRSWLSMSTAVGVGAGLVGMLLGLGDHTDAILSVTRGVGVLIAVAFMTRMLFATFRGSIHPVGGLGISMLVMVIFFPVVHPWYILWAVLPLAAWANRLIFRFTVVVYSAAMSFFVLPRGLGLPPSTVVAIYIAAALSFAVVCLAWWVALRRARVSVLN
ncbi:polyprenol phosphomannose-dependent alpha 1,6 mannosyltransferase MptB [Corynebacterium flavescens]|uniref:polyprenol phosphomannose-dependent alpha 1,6 mannosyltransferase MptB n=1 Tax=Corynebacterium flavescens TaxID=28028 RepID=UPI003FCF0E63